MSKIIAIIVPAALAGQSIPTKARLEQSPTLSGVRTLVAEALLVDLGLIEAPQELQWEVDVDGTGYLWLTLLSAIDEPSGTLVIGPAAAVGKVGVDVWSIDAIGQVKEGVEIEVVPVVIPAESGSRTITDPAQVPTDAAGYARILLDADSGVYRIVIGRKEKKIDTAGKSGLIFNWNTLL